MLRRLAFLLADPPVSPALTRWIYIVWLVTSLALFLAIALGYGPHVTPDGQRDIVFSSLLVSANFNPFGLVEAVRPLQEGFEMPQSPLGYYVYLGMLAAAEYIGGANWPGVVAITNAVIVTFAGILLIKIIQSAVGTTGAILVSIGFLAGVWENLQWIAMTQSDPLYMLTSMTAVLFVWRASVSVGKQSMHRDWAIAAAFILANQFVRPTAVPLAVFGALVYLLVSPTTNETAQTLIRRFRLVFTSLAIAITAGILLHAWMLYAPEAWAWAGLKSLAEFFRPYHAQGWVVWVHPETYVEPPDSILGFARISFLRLIYFFWFLADDYSAPHKILNGVAFVPLYALCGVGLWAAFSRQSGLKPTARHLAFLAILYIVSVDTYHAVTILDFDWRYRTPTYWAMYSLAAIGAHRLFSALAQHLRSAEERTSG